MWSMFARFSEKLLPSSQPRRIRRASQCFRPSLEVLECRLLLDAYTFLPNAAGDGVSWNDPNNWLNLTNPNITAVPGGGDDASIGDGFNVVLAGAAGNVNSLVTSSASSLTIVASDQLTLNNDSSITGALFDPGHLIANTTNPFTGTTVTLTGAAAIGPGDLNGNLDAGPNSSIVLAGGPTDVLGVGATLGPGTGTLVIDGAVTVNGTLDDNAMTMSVVPGGALLGSGSLNERAILNWTGGTLALTGGVDIASSGELVASDGAGGPSPLTLDTVLTNESVFAELGGTGGLFLGPGDAITNLTGILRLSQVAVTNSGGGTGGILNDPLAIFDVTALASSPSIVSVPLTNEGNFDVDSGDELILTTPLGASGPAIDLDGALNVNGQLTLLTTATSVTGFGLGGSGVFEIGSTMGGPGIPAGSGTLIVPTGATDLIGNMEVSGAGTLTGGGTISNNGRLQLDLGAATSFGNYVAGNSGRLALAVSSSSSYETLTVTGTASLSGSLVLLNYTPVVGDSFDVVVAAAIEHHFDSVPSGMVETDTATTATVTQTSPPA